MTHCLDGYQKALFHARQRNYECSRQAFETYLQKSPHHCKAWISFAQMERQTNRARCSYVLRKGLRENPDSACILQALGLYELKRKNYKLSKDLLLKSVQIDPAMAAVLRWKQVRDMPYS